MSPGTPAPAPVVQIAAGLHLLPTDPSNVYLWTGGNGVTLVDTGLPGSEAAIAAALHALGYTPGDVTRVVLTHWHADHSGAAAAVAAWGAQVWVGRADAPVVRGEVAGRAPKLTDAERPDFEQLSASQPPAPPCPVDRELDHGDPLDDGAAELVVATPGHTPGALAVHLPALGVVLTGDTAVGAGGRLQLGPFNTDPAAARDALRDLVGLGAKIAGPGHGAPVLNGASAALADAAARATSDRGRARDR